MLNELILRLLLEELMLLPFEVRSRVMEAVSRILCLEIHDPRKERIKEKYPFLDNCFIWINDDIYYYSAAFNTFIAFSNGYEMCGWILPDRGKDESENIFKQQYFQKKSRVEYETKIMTAGQLMNIFDNISNPLERELVMQVMGVLSTNEEFQLDVAMEQLEKFVESYHKGDSYRIISAKGDEFNYSPFTNRVRKEFE